MIDRTRVRLAALLLAAIGAALPAHAYEVLVFSGLEETTQWLESEGWWGEVNRTEQLDVPRAMITGINPRWRTVSQGLPVSQKKEVFYRLMLPLIMHANQMVMDRRERLIDARAALTDGKPVSSDALVFIREGAVLLRVLDADKAAALNADDPALAGVIDDMLYRLDVIPNGLALGQAAYESGYGTSRFAAEGNALFGQWTYGGKGLVPEQQRSNLGDHRIAAFDWPFDSVRGYFINLMSHPAYEDFRRLRAELRAEGKPLTSIALADGLIRYSERGQEYIDTLKSIIRVNGLDITDNAVFRDEPIRFLVGAQDQQAAAALRGEIERLRSSGELDTIVARMRLE